MQASQSTHKTLAENKNFDAKINSLVQFLNEDHHEAPRVKPNSKSQESFQNGGYRIPIEKAFRKNAEHRYRQFAKRKTQLWAQTLDEGSIVPNIAYCQPWDWRW